ncbi:MAG: AAA family ATPase [Polyangiaceae bacterium]|nr:AAA family ATPase [Polyangiaceae bacterium]
MPLVREVTIENYKSIRALTLQLGRINVLIGANGSGKSNILEAITLGTAAARNKLDNEYLAPRGVRVTEPRFMRSAFPETDPASPIVVAVELEGAPKGRWPIDPDHRRFAAPGPGRATMLLADPEKFMKQFFSALERRAKREPHIRDAISNIDANRDDVRDYLFSLAEAELPPEFFIFAPENSALRTFQSESQILPLGTKGEGLFAHLKALSTPAHADTLADIGNRLALFDWFERLEIPRDLAPGERSILIRDRYLAEGALFDQRSANEGFLFLLFYLTLFISPETPRFFAIDNVDTSLNPSLVTKLVEVLVELAAKHDKQVIFTTHNPAVLDALDLRDDEQRLFVAERTTDGGTRVRRAAPPKPLDGEPPVPLPA